VEEGEFYRRDGVAEGLGFKRIGEESGVIMVRRAVFIQESLAGMTSGPCLSVA
jgi:hypothetical protein